MDERGDIISSSSKVSAALTELGWRLLLGAARTGIRVESLAAGAAAAGRAIAAAGDDADGRLRADLRPGRVLLTVQPPALGPLTEREVDIARRISAAVAELGLATDAEVGGAERASQQLEIGIDALDIPAVRPFWRAVLGYIDDPGDDPPNGLADPLGQGPSIWFQQMDAPRPERNRIHFDISVPHDEAPGRIAAAQAAGGRLLYDAEAPAFWVLADPEGNEACICTWRGRDG